MNPHQTPNHDRFADLFEETPSCLLVIERSSERLFACNRAATETLARDDSDADNLLDRLAETLPEGHLRKRLDSLDPNAPPVQETIACSCADKGCRWFELILTPLPEADQTLIQFRDITTQKQRERELIQQNEELSRSNTELEQFAFVASHDLREPLRKVLAFGDLLKLECGDELSPSGHDYLAIMQRAANRMQQLISSLLILSRVTSKGSPFEPIALNEVLKNVISDLQIQMTEKGADIECDQLPDIEADESQIHRLFQNLLDNALKYSREEEPPRIQIRAEGFQQLPGRGNACRISVSDNGIGFKEDETERIFQAFQRLHSRKKFEGSGIGLAICRKIVKRHGGILKAKATPGQGATFTIILPLRQPKQDEP
jgi:signal transduction histidine kinase